MTPFHYKHVMWDWNGTILNDVHLCHEITNAMLSQKSLAHLSLPEYQAIFRHPVSAVYLELGLGDSEEEYDQLSREFHQLYEQKRRGCVPHSGAVEMLTELTERNVTSSILSAHPQSMLEEIVREVELARWFSDIVGLPHHRADSKVDRGREWLDNHHVRGGDVLLIGDTDHDHEVAQALGVDCVLVAQGFQTKERLERLGVPVFDSLEHLLTAITS